MKNNDISPEVRRFILTSIASVPHIEALILVCATAECGWTTSALARRLYVTPASAASVLDDLHKSGMLARDEASGTYFYQSNPLSGMIEQVAALYTSHLVEITVLIHSKLDRRAQQFADAFNLRKDS